MKIFFLDEVHSILEERLCSKGFTCIDATLMGLEELKQELIQADGIVIRSRFTLNKELLDLAINLKFIARSGAGMENIDVAYCDTRGIILFNAPEGNKSAVGEHAIGMLLSLFNKICQGNNEIRSGRWNREGNRGIELEGKTVGIIGYGNNGGAFARKLQGFDCTVLAYDKYKTGFGNQHVEEVSLEKIFQDADILSLHIPQTEETLGLINTEFLEQFKKPIYLINLSRGKIVETKALVNAIKKQKVLGACLDVLEYEKTSFESFFEEEMPEDFSYLIHSEKVLLTPHVGGWTVESYYKLSNVLADKILSHFG